MTAGEEDRFDDSGAAKCASEFPPAFLCLLHSYKNKVIILLLVSYDVVIQNLLRSKDSNMKFIRRTKSTNLLKYLPSSEDSECRNLLSEPGML